MCEIFINPGPLSNNKAITTKICAVIAGPVLLGAGHCGTEFDYVGYITKILYLVAACRYLYSTVVREFSFISSVQAATSNFAPL